MKKKFFFCLMCFFSFTIMCESSLLNQSLKHTLKLNEDENLMSRIIKIWTNGNVRCKRFPFLLFFRNEAYSCVYERDFRLTHFFHFISLWSIYGGKIYYMLNDIFHSSKSEEKKTNLFHFIIKMQCMSF